MPCAGCGRFGYRSVETLRPVPSNIRYLVLGLAGGIVLMSVLVSSVILFAGPAVLLRNANQQVQSPSSWDLTLAAIPSPSATATFTPLPTSTTVILPSTTPFPTQTPDPILAAINTGKMIFTGPLTNDQQVRLYAASLTYVQTTVKDSIRESKAINGVGYGDPSNICGPLALAIMRDAGLVPSETDPHDFWLLDPNATDDARRLEQIFPPLQYERSRVLTPINKVDWSESPLEPGDFLFIWHGSGGNFDHMLVVSRVDKDHRAYAVTNFGTPEGYLIAETMLYDPKDPAQGIFHTWTKERDAILGSTGFGGYDLWRLRSP